MFYWFASSSSSDVSLSVDGDAGLASVLVVDVLLIRSVAD